MMAGKKCRHIICFYLALLTVSLGACSASTKTAPLSLGDIQKQNSFQYHMTAEANGTPFYVQTRWQDGEDWLLTQEIEGKVTEKWVQVDGKAYRQVMSYTDKDGSFEQWQEDDPTAIVSLGQGWDDILPDMDALIVIASEATEDGVRMTCNAPLLETGGGAYAMAEHTVWFLVNGDGVLLEVTEEMLLSPKDDPDAVPLDYVVKKEFSYGTASRTQIDDAFKIAKSSSGS